MALNEQAKAWEQSKGNNSFSKAPRQVCCFQRGSLVGLQRTPCGPCEVHLISDPSLWRRLQYAERVKGLYNREAVYTTRASEKHIDVLVVLGSQLSNQLLCLRLPHAVPAMNSLCALCSALEVNILGRTMIASQGNKNQRHALPWAVIPNH